jgi:hypothetical protein
MGVCSVVVGVREACLRHVVVCVAPSQQQTTDTGDEVATGNPDSDVPIDWSKTSFKVRRPAGIGAEKKMPIVGPMRV